MFIDPIIPPTKLFFQLTTKPRHKPMGKKQNRITSLVELNIEVCSLKSSPAKNIPMKNRVKMLNTRAVHSMALSTILNVF